MEKRELSISDYAAAVMRRLTVALVSFIIVLVAGVYVAYALPTKYRSTGLISVETRDLDVSTDLVQTSGTDYAETQLEFVWQRVMYTSSLATIVQKYGLYPDLVETDPTYRLAAQALRENTFLEPKSVEIASADTRRARSATIAFSLSFDYDDAVTARQVATELVDLYLKENAETRTNQTQQTVEFLQLDIEKASVQADQAADELARFKERHAGNLPELLNFQLQSIERTEQQLDILDREIRDSRNRQFTVETELAKTNPFGNSVDADGNPIVGTADRLAQLQAERLRLLSIYTPEHSDVKRIEREIEILTGGGSAATSPEAIRAQLNIVLAELQEARLTLTEDHPDVVRLARNAEVLREQLREALSFGAQQPALADLALRDPVVQQLRQQIQAEQSYHRSLLRRRAELEEKLDELRAKVAAMPQIEREYAMLVRQNDLAIARYNEAVERIDAAQRAQTLEAEVGERFTLIEAPFLPISPYSPNRKAIVLLAGMVAVGIAIGLAVFVDTLDESVKGSVDMVRVTGTPPLAVIPVLETPSDRRRRHAAILAKSTFFISGLAAAFGIATTMAG
jgi:uncharacterized protein involved in exopolysaccharide biosynthesis